MTTLIEVLCGPERTSWWQPDLGLRLVETARLLGVHVDTTYGVAGYPAARNRAAETFMASGCDVLAMLDNDTTPPAGFLPAVLDFIKSRPDADVICLPYYMRPHPDDPTSLLCVGWKTAEPDTFDLPSQLEPGWQQIDAGGAGCMFITRRVLEKMPMPFRIPEHAWKNHMLSGACEDFTFCSDAKALGFHVWTNGDLICDHWHSVNLSAVARRVDVRAQADIELLRRLGIPCPTVHRVSASGAR